MEREKLKYLFTKYTNNTITRSELMDLLSRMRGMDEESLDSVLEELKNQGLSVFKGQNDLFNSEKVFEKIQNQIHENSFEKNLRKQRFKKWMSIAAAVVLIIGVSLVWFKKGGLIDPEIVETNEIQLPDQNLAVVTFEDGSMLSLSAADEETLNKEGIELVTMANGELMFRIKPAKRTESRFQTFRSPKGTSSTVVLADGSTVWLNSGAEITYPTSFSSEQRKVSLEGEAYFDVFHNPDHPFVVSANGTDIKVLGTEFNIATGRDNPQTFTTLISGSVEVYTATQKTKLKPGLQSVTDFSSDQIKTREVDLREVTAWKDGYFRFKDDDIQEVLSKIQTWYDIQDIDIQENTHDRFTGSVMRTRKLSDLLEQLEKISSYRFEIKEGRVTVMK